MDSVRHGASMVQEGDHLDVPNRACLPYKYIRSLGMGSCAFVEMAQDETNGQVFALKHLRRYQGRNLNQFKRAFQNEVDILRRLSLNPHIIKAFATWGSGRELGIVMTPVADGGDLASFLQTIVDLGNLPTTEQYTILNRAFGCLASGLAFIHKQTIRHKDIKPQNILIHQGYVIYTDFGIALDTSQLENTTTDGTTYAFTFRYCAPEVASSEKRNRKSDVFSLGCVFAEILSVLEPQFQLRECGTTAYHKILEDLQDALGHYMQASPQRAQLVYACLNMLKRRPEDRISAEELVKELCSSRKLEGDPKYEYFCDFCTPVKDLKSIDVATTAFGEVERASQKGKYQGTPGTITTCTGQQVLQETQGVVSASDYPEPLLQIILDRLDRISRIELPCMEFSPDGKLFASVSIDDRMELWNLTSQPATLLDKLESYDIRNIVAVKVSPDSKLLASGSSDGEVRLWDLTAANISRRLLQGCYGVVLALAFSPDSQLLASRSFKGVVRLLDSTAAETLCRLFRDLSITIWAMAFSLDGKLLASGSLDGEMRLWDLTAAEIFYRPL